jgi:hypothetical protein
VKFHLISFADIAVVFAEIGYELICVKTEEEAEIVLMI